MCRNEILLCVISFYTLAITEPVSRTLDIPKLTALNDSSHVIQLYQDIADKSEPSEKDLTTDNALIRSRICKDITSTGYFHDLGLLPIELDPGTAQPYAIRQLSVNVNGFCRSEDFCFKCHFEIVRTGRVREFYVSKEYNVSSVPDLYKPGRFVVGRISMAHLPFPTNNLILAEESATAYTGFDFNVELHCLRIKKRIIRRVASKAVDLLCRIVPVDPEDTHNQHRRLCVAALTSSYFQQRFVHAYPRGPSHRCIRKKIAFRTPIARRKAAGRSYYERVTPCFFGGSDQEDPILCISRGFFSNQVFVLRRDPRLGEVYLESLSTNISIADDLHSFDFVES